MKLNDQKNWSFSAIPSLNTWFRQFAPILQLGEGQGEDILNHLHYLTPDSDFAHEIRSAGQFYENQIARIWYAHDSQNAFCEVKQGKHEHEILSMWYSMQPIYQRSMKHGGLPFHAGLVELDGKGILIAGHGDAGKSTTCRRFPAPWKALSDDETLVVFDKSGKYLAHPFPTWSEYLWKLSERTWDVQYSVPLTAIFFIIQHETDEVIPMTEMEAALMITRSANQTCRKFWVKSDKKLQRQFKTEIFNNACEIAKKIPAYALRISLHGNFWGKIEEVI